MKRVGFFATCAAVLLWPLALALAVREWAPIGWAFLTAAGVATFFAVFNRQ